MPLFSILSAPLSLFTEPYPSLPNITSAAISTKSLFVPKLVPLLVPLLVHC